MNTATDPVSYARENINQIIYDTETPLITTKINIII